MRSIRPWAMARWTPRKNIERAIRVQRRRSSQIYRVMVRRGRSSMMVLHERVRKWEGFERMLGSEDIYAKRIVLPIRA